MYLFTTQPNQLKLFWWKSWSVICLWWNDHISFCTWCLEFTITGRSGVGHWVACSSSSQRTLWLLLPGIFNVDWLKKTVAGWHVWSISGESLFVDKQFEWSAHMADPASNDEKYYKSMITECWYIEWLLPNNAENKLHQNWVWFHETLEDYNCSSTYMLNLLIPLDKLEIFTCSADLLCTYWKTPLCRQIIELNQMEV